MNPYNEAFTRLLTSLNPGQRTAVDQTEGPVLVLAGPGTGKTQVLAARIGNILLTTDTRPQNILCLTFTDAGVSAMRQRLLSLIGPDAHRVPIMTYHSFCNRVIQENMEYFGQKDMEPLSELERIDIIRGIIDALPPEHPLREGYKQQYQYEGHLRQLFNLMKTEGWKPGTIHRTADQWLRELPENEAFIYKRNAKGGKKGELKADKVADETLRMTRLKEAADLYPKYNRTLVREARYEFEDMILWTIRAFEKHPELLRNYQERYLYVLVDEFQDTNGAQNQLLHLLLNYWESPNIFIVGDDDQSIFEFQGARLQNLLDFYEQHKETVLTITLTENYRSTQPILDLSSRLIDQNTLRAVRHFPVAVSKQLRAAGKVSDGAIQQRVFPNRLTEDTFLAQQIQQLLQSGVPASEIAVLCARHKQYERLMTLLDKSGIPYQTKRPLNILHTPLILHLREILSYLRDEMRMPYSGEPRLFKILHAPFFGIEAIELARMAMQLQQDRNSWRAELLQSEWTLARHLVQLPGMHQYALPTLMELILTRLGILPYILQQPDKTLHLQVLATWMEYVKAGVERDPAFNLEKLLDQLDSMEDNRIQLLLQQTVRMGDGIQLLTAHGAKGLEFEYVFIPDCTEENWEPAAKDAARKFTLPPTLSHSGEEDAMEARRRLFYVAVTRAKRFLHISYSQATDAGKLLNHARFMDETGVETVFHELPASDLLTTQAALMMELAQPVITLPDASVFELFFENYALSTKGLNKYLRCPLAFYYEEVLRVPSSTSEAAATGLAMHTALQQYFLLMQRDKKAQFPPVEKLVGYFTNEMDRMKNLFSEQSWQQRRALGQKVLQRYWTEQIPYWRKRSKVEFELKNVELEGIPLKGVIDKIEYSEQNTLRIVDYKTGIYDKKRSAFPSEELPLGGDYYRQLLFYKVLVEQSHLFSETVAKGVISWIEPNNKGNLVYDEMAFTKEDSTWMRQLITETYANIRQLKFDTGCGEPDCAWCRMTREHSLPDLIPKPEDGLDD